MKIRHFGITLSLLLVFCLCLSLSAQVRVDTSNDSPLEKAERAHRDAIEEHAATERLVIRWGDVYGLANTAWESLSTAYNIAKSKDKGEFDDLKGSVSKTLDAVQLDLVDALTDAAGFALQKIEDKVWNHLTLSDNKPAILSAMAGQDLRRSTVYDKWQRAIRNEKAAWAKRVAAKEALQELEAVVYTFGPKGKTTIYAGDSHTAFLSLSKKWSSVKWYVKYSSETGKGRLKYGVYDNSDGSKTSEFMYDYSTPGEYVISVEAEMESTNEVVENSYTLTVIPTGITFNKKFFMSNETLVVTVERDNLVRTGMWINGRTIAHATPQSAGKAVMSYNLSTFLQEGQNFNVGDIAIYVHTFESNPYKELSTSHGDWIYVYKAYESVTASNPDSPSSLSLEKGQDKRSLRLTWEKSDSDGGSQIDEYQYQYRHWKEGSGWQLPSEWESAGKGTSKLISGLRSETKYCVRMRAKNKAGKHSDPTNWSGSVTTR